MSTIQLRAALEPDLPAIAGIHRHYVLRTVSTLEYMRSSRLSKKLRGADGDRQGDDIQRGASHIRCIA